MEELQDLLNIPQKELEVGEWIARGCSGVVFKGVWRHQGEDMVVAIKKIKVNSEDTIEGICKELKIMHSHQFEHVCKLYGGCWVNGSERGGGSEEKEKGNSTNGSEQVWLVTEYIEGGDLNFFLRKHKGPLSKDLQLSFCIQATQAISSLHNAPFPTLHRDIKSLNFLVQNNTKLLLTDFGFAKRKALISSRSLTLGTVRWAAPEIIARPTHPQWSEKADIYSLGMVMYEIVTKTFPYCEDANDNVILRKIRSGILPVIPSNCPKEIGLAIHLCWNVDPSKRPSATDLLLLLRGDKAPDPINHLVKPLSREGKHKRKKSILRTYSERDRKARASSSAQFFTQNTPTIPSPPSPSAPVSRNPSPPPPTTRHQSAPNFARSAANKRHTLASPSFNNINHNINLHNNNNNNYNINGNSNNKSNGKNNENSKSSVKRGLMLSQSNPEILTPRLVSNRHSLNAISIPVPYDPTPSPSPSPSPCPSPLPSLPSSPQHSPGTSPRSHVEILLDKIEESETLLNSLEVQLKCETLKRIEEDGRKNKKPFEPEMLDLESYKELGHRYSIVLEQLETNKEALNKLHPPPLQKRATTTYKLRPDTDTQKRRTSSFGDALSHMGKAFIRPLTPSKFKHKEGKNRNDISTKIEEIESSENDFVPPSVKVEHFKQLIELKYRSENIQTPFLHNLKHKWRQHPLPN